MKPRDFTLMVPAALTAAGAAPGSIIHTEVGITLLDGQSHAFDITGDGNDNFSLSVETSGTFSPFGSGLADLYFQSEDGGKTQATVSSSEVTLQPFAVGGDGRGGSWAVAA